LRVALSALGVTREGGEYSLRIELMTEGAVCPEAGLGVDPAPGVDVAGMRELEQNRALLFVAREGEQCVRSRGWKAGVTLVANFLIQVRAEGIGVARHTLIMAGTL